MRIETKQPNQAECPPGLLVIADLLTRVPERKKDLLDHEIAERVRERTLTRETRHLLSWHPLHTTKTVLLYGVHAFLLAWVVGSLASLGRAYSAIKEAEVTIPLPVVKDFVFNIGTFVPTSTTFGIASQLPAITFRNALIIGLVVAGAVAIEKVVFAAIHWNKTRALQASENELGKEIATLKEWRRGM